MSVVKRDHTQHDTMGGGALGDPCFYCGRTTGDPSIFWLGRTGSIILHPQCAIDVTIRLLRDVHEVQCTGHGRTPQLCAEGAR